LRFNKLFEPGNIGTLEIPNRIVMAPMGTGFAGLDGRLGKRHINYYAERAKGGVGLIITTVVKVERSIDPIDRCSFPIPVLDDNRLIPDFSELADRIHEYGSKVAVQLSLGFGRNADNISSERPPISASAVPSFHDPKVLARELTIEEIRELIKAFGDAAERVKRAGIDAIEIHAHTGYLLDQFMTSLWNKRGDAYGGDLEGRLRLPLEIIEEVRGRLGRDFPLIFRYSADHMIKGGRKIEESKEIAKRLEEAGVDALHIDAGCYEAMPWIFPPEYYEQGCLVHLAEEIKRVVDIPIITVGRISDPEFAEKILEEGRADFIAMGRQLLADSEWPKKVREGKIEDIRRCIACNEGCIGRLFAIKPISCTLNPEVGREGEYRITPALKRKKVLVIGGGPAGMEAARVAGLRGHDVTLCEKTDKLGGLLIPAAMPEFKKDLNHIIKYYSTQLRKLNVKVELNKEVTLETVNEMKPDVVIVATGSTPFIPKIPGINKRIVVKAIDVLLGKVEVKDKVCHSRRRVSRL